MQFWSGTAFMKTPEALAVARMLDEAGFDGIVCSDHMIYPRELASPFTHLRDAFDVLYAENAAGTPKMLSIGLHCRPVGRPARTAALERFLDHVQSHNKVWIARRVDIARHWVEHFPPASRVETKPNFPETAFRYRFARKRA